MRIHRELALRAVGRQDEALAPQTGISVWADLAPRGPVLGLLAIVAVLLLSSCGVVTTVEPKEEPARSNPTLPATTRRLSPIFRIMPRTLRTPSENRVGRLRTPLSASR